MNFHINKSNFKRYRSGLFELFLIPFLFSIGVGVLLDNFNLTTFWPVIVPTFFTTWPLYYLVSRSLKYKERINDVYLKVNKIESSISLPINKIATNIDNHVFKTKRHPFYIKQIKSISGYDENSFSNQLQSILEKWEKKSTDNEIELWRIIYERLLNDFKYSEDNNIYLISLNNYLNLLLDIIELCFKFEGKFVYHSYTNALPSSWFDMTKNKHLHKYMGKFSELLKDHGKGNDLKRYVLTYEVEGQDYKNDIPSSATLIKDWNKLSSQSKSNYLEKFILNKDGYYVKLHEKFNFLKDFTELIYLGYMEKNNVIWKWAFTTEYIYGRDIVKFSLYQIKNDSLDILEIDGDIHEPNTGYKHNKIYINLKDFPAYIEKCPYQINGNNIMKCEMLKNR